MATTIKVTKAVKFGMIAEYFESNPDMVIGTASAKSGKDMVEVPVTGAMLAEAMRHEIEMLTKKSATVSPKEKAKQEVRKNYADALLNFLHEHKDEKFTISELQRAVPEFPADISTPAVTALFRQTELIMHSVRTMDKGRAYYQYLD